MIDFLFIISIILAALILGGGLAHLYALPNKIKLPPVEYFIVQQIYRGWALLGIAVILALISTLVLTIVLITKGDMFLLPLSAFISLLLTQLIFWFYTYPVNKLTKNWTDLPANWSILRKRWEYSHAVSAVLTFAALVLLVISITGKT